MTQKFFIDCGAHEGESVRLFKSQYPNSGDYRIVSFEPNPAMLEKFKAEDLLDVEFHPVAVWVEDGTIDFYQHQWDVGMTLYKENYRVKSLPPIKVKSIDFSRWLSENTSPDDYVVLKMDIECAEYAVLEKMIADGTIDRINKFYVEWHYDYTPDSEALEIRTKQHERILSELSLRGIKDLYWCAGPGRTEIPEKDVL